MEKNWNKSKTMIFNGITILVVVASFLGYVPDQQLAEKVSGILLAVAPVIKLVLRLVTDKPIKFGKVE